MAILDIYPVPTYISASPPSILNAPIRALQSSATNNPSLPLPQSIKPFAPPNLIQSSVSAALSSVLEASSIPCTLFLVPSKHIPPSIQSSSFEPLPSRTGLGYAEDWDLGLLEQVTKAMKSIGALEEVKWDTKFGDEKHTHDIKNSRRGDIGEGSMYI